jgi:hypothetical protein
MSMKARCNNPNNEDFPDYGGRGIKVCARWQASFANFLADVGKRPSGKTLDRWPNNDGDYEPDNVRWGTPKEQRANRRPMKPHGPLSAETRAKIGASHRGMKHSAETLAKMSASHLGKPWSEKRRAAQQARHMRRDDQVQYLRESSRETAARSK